MCRKAFLRIINIFLAPHTGWQASLKVSMLLLHSHGYHSISHLNWQASAIDTLCRI